jgi:hypothetical protein
MRYVAIAAVVGVALAGVATAQSNVDGTYTGQAGQWNLKLTVKGTRDDLVMTCSNDFLLTIKVGPDGKIDDYVTTGSGRRRLTGNVNGTINVEPGGSCGGGVATMVKK